ncbi:cytochrome P450 724B1-like [Miscanthus floridulus]|uniref:cytochrome P450 724B1-like n=1 Tax=Miscanthus floridulus TaxID=154761 RepID=UPI0034588DAF
MTMVGLMAVLLAVFVAVVLGAMVFRHFAPLFQNPGVPRGRWPLVGETLGFLRPHASNTTGAFLHDHVTRYGSVFKAHLFGAPTVVSCDAEPNHFVLQNEARLFQCSYPGSVHGILGGSSMVVAPGEHRRRLQCVALALVASTGLRPSYLADVDRAAASAVACWRPTTGRKVLRRSQKVRFGVIVEQVLGLGSDEPARSRISLTLEGIIERRKGGSYNKQLAAFLYVLLSSNELSHDDKVSFVLDTLLAGYETTSVLLSLAVYFLGKSTHCLEELKRQHESIRSGKGMGEFLMAEDYKMEYTQHVINETLRCGCRNVVKFVHRKARKDTVDSSSDSSDDEDDEVSSGEIGDVALFMRKYKKGLKREGYKFVKRRFPNKQKRKCYNCRSTEHFIADCPYENKEDKKDKKKKHYKKDDKIQHKKKNYSGQAHIGHE